MLIEIRTRSINKIGDDFYLKISLNKTGMDLHGREKGKWLSKTEQAGFI